MTARLPAPVRARCRRLALGGLCGLLLMNPMGSARAAEAAYPFEGTWVRNDRVCNATTTRSRTYTAKEVTSARGKCSIRRVAAGAGSFELLEDCRRNDRPQTVTETIRMTSPDAMVLKRQLVRLKIPRPIRYMRCSQANPNSPRPVRPSFPAVETPRRTP